MSQEKQIIQIIENFTKETRNYFDEKTNQISLKIDEIDNKVDDFKVHFDERTNLIDQKVNELGNRFGILNNKFDDLKNYFDEKTEEAKRHFGVIAESLEDKIKIVAEQVAANTEKLFEHDERFDRLDETLKYIQIQLHHKSDRNELAQFKKQLKFSS